MFELSVQQIIAAGSEQGLEWLANLKHFRAVSVLALSAALFAIGAWGVLARRNALIMLISVEVMLNAVNLTLITFARCFSGNQNLIAQLGKPFTGETGQIFALFIIAVAAAEATVGLAILLLGFRNRQTVDTRQMKSLQH